LEENQGNYLQLIMPAQRRIQSIVTKKGDNGNTYTLSGHKLPKDDLRLEVAGTMDELGSFLGMAKSLVRDKGGKDILERVQNDLFIVGSRISGSESKNSGKTMLSKYVKYLDDEIKKLEEKYLFRGFVLAGNNLLCATLHVCRTVARRLERRVVALKNKEQFKNKNILVYLNRLSDLLFLLACRYSLEGLNHRGGYMK
jgi:cob(I)alamin adenosyltransferase